MIIHHTALWAWLLPVLLSSSWLAGSIAFWRARPRDGFLPLSHAELFGRR